MSNNSTTSTRSWPADSTLPHRFRRSSFEYYEKIIAAVVNSYPNVVSFNPALYKLTSITFSCRLRDAMKSYYTYRWPTDAFSEETFLRAYDNKIVVSEHMETSTVDTGSKANIKAKYHGKLDIKETIGIHVDGNREPLLLANLDPIQVDLLCKLAGERALSAEVSFLRTPEITDHLINALRQRYDCSIEPSSKQGYLTIL